MARLTRATPLTLPSAPGRLPGERLDTLRRKLSERGHRVTPQRLHVLRALLAADGHPTAEEVWARVRRDSPTTSLATIYKTLDTLQGMGEVMALETRDKRHHYDALRPEAHPHAVCTGCGRIDDVNVDGAGAFQALAAAASGYRIQEQHVTFYGLCRACQG